VNSLLGRRSGCARGAGYVCWRACGAGARIDEAQGVADGPEEITSLMLVGLRIQVGLGVSVGGRLEDGIVVGYLALHLSREVELGPLLLRGGKSGQNGDGGHENGRGMHPGKYILKIDVEVD
jgi:hypothetical protein